MLPGGSGRAALGNSGVWALTSLRGSVQACLQGTAVAGVLMMQMECRGCVRAAAFVLVAPGQPTGAAQWSAGAAALSRLRTTTEALGGE